MLNIPCDVIDCEPVTVRSVVATEITVVKVSFSKSVVVLFSVSGKDVAMLEGVVLKVLELNFVVLVTGVVVAEAVFEVVVTGVVTITVLEVLESNVGTLVVGLAVLVVVVVCAVVVVVVVVAGGVGVVENCKPINTSWILVKRTFSSL